MRAWDGWGLGNMASLEQKSISSAYFLQETPYLFSLTKSLCPSLKCKHRYTTTPLNCWSGQHYGRMILLYALPKYSQQELPSRLTMWMDPKTCICMVSAVESRLIFSEVSNGLRLVIQVNQCHENKHHFACSPPDIYNIHVDDRDPSCHVSVLGMVCRWVWECNIGYTSRWWIKTLIKGLERCFSSELHVSGSYKCLLLLKRTWVWFITPSSNGTILASTGTCYMCTCTYRYKYTQPWKKIAG